MELDELKKTWASVEERLKENEMLNKRIMHEMLSTKSNKSLSKLINFEFFGMLVVFAIPVCIWLYNHPAFKNTLFPKIMFIVGIVISILTPFIQLYKLKYLLMKIDFSKSIGDNIYLTNKYSIIIKKEKIINYFIFIPVFSLLGILSYHELNATFSLWIFLFIALAVAIAFVYWSYKNIYDANIESIKNSLEELEELKEE